LLIEPFLHFQAVAQELLGFAQLLRAARQICFLPVLDAPSQFFDCLSQSAHLVAKISQQLFGCRISPLFRVNQSHLTVPSSCVISARETRKNGRRRSPRPFAHVF
jgi:hypothetical protein